jgi:hypothetical protein
MEVFTGYCRKTEIKISNHMGGFKCGLLYQRSLPQDMWVCLRKVKATHAHACMHEREREREMHTYVHMEDTVTQHDLGSILSFMSPVPASQPAIHPSIHPSIIIIIIIMLSVGVNSIPPLRCFKSFEIILSRWFPSVLNLWRCFSYHCWE